MKERITLTMDREQLDWIDNKIGRKIFANRSHALEYLIKRRMEGNPKNEF